MWNDLISLIFPNVCIGCKSMLAKEEEFICTKCRSELPITSMSQFETEAFHYKLINSHQYNFAYSFLKFYKSGITQKILHAIKYDNQPAIAEFMGNLAGIELKKLVSDNRPSLIIPIPLHPIKKLKRGYNQSEPFAKGLSSSLHIEWNDHLVKRILNNPTQTKKTRTERQENVRNVFAVENPELLEDKSILLVDDVATTGATLDACSSVMIKCNIRQISVCTIAAAQ